MPTQIFLALMSPHCTIEVADQILKNKLFLQIFQNKNFSITNTIKIKNLKGDSKTQFKQQKQHKNIFLRKISICKQLMVK